VNAECECGCGMKKIHKNPLSLVMMTLMVCGVLVSGTSFAGSWSGQGRSRPGGQSPDPGENRAWQEAVLRPEALRRRHHELLHLPRSGERLLDDLAISLSYPTTRNWRNSPTLINVGFQKFLFHDGRAHTSKSRRCSP